MKRSNWDEWARPYAGPTAEVELDLPCVGFMRRSVAPDPLSVMIAAESGRPILYPVFAINAYGPNSPLQVLDGAGAQPCRSA